MSKIGEPFLHKKDPQLHASTSVRHEQKRRRRAGQETSHRPTDMIANWLEVIEKTHTGHADDPQVLERIKDFYHKRHVIKPEDVPEAAFLLEQQIARELGHGTVELTDEFKERKTNQIIADQKESLNRWIDYLSSENADYPMWAKYWAFTSMVQMGKFEKVEKGKPGKEEEYGRFAKRERDTVAAFPMMNPRALANTISAMEKKLERKQMPKDERKKTPVKNLSDRLSDPEFQQLLSTEEFSKLYAQFLIEIPEYSTEGLQETRGEWKKYEKGSDPKPLVDSLDGHPLEWCTANLDTARTQLEGGDFYVYYSYDQEEKPTIPRVAIRMTGDKIAEVRGIAQGQNMDPYIGDAVDEKLEEFPDKEKYKKKLEDMRRLTEIEKLVKGGGEKLEIEDLKFLYEMDEKIQGFGQGRDPRIEEVKEKRDQKKDYAQLYNRPEEEIALTMDDIDKSTTLLVGNLSLKDGGFMDLPDGLTHILGYLDAWYSDQKELPAGLEYIGGDLILKESKYIKELPAGLKHIGGDLDLRENCVLKTLPDGLTYIGGRILLHKSIVEELPDGLEYIGGIALERNKISKLPDSLTEIGKYGLCLKGNIKIRRLPDGLKRVDGDMDLRLSVVSRLPDGLEHVGGSLDIDFGLSLPPSLTYVGGSLGLVRSRQKKLPPGLEYIGKHLFIRESQIEELPAGLTYIGGDLDLLGNVTLKKLPAGLTYIGGDLDLLYSSLVELPAGLTYVGGFLSLGKTPIKKIPKGLTYVGDDLYLNRQIEEMPENIEEIVKGKIYRAGR